MGNWDLYVGPKVYEQFREAFEGKQTDNNSKTEIMAKKKEETRKDWIKELQANGRYYPNGGFLVNKEYMQKLEKEVKKK